jgi:hypothetical protein
MNRNEILRNDLEEEVDVGLPEGAGANLDLDVDNLADLIGQVTLTERLPVEPPPDVRQPVIRNVDRPLALTEELMPLNIARNDLRRDTQNLQMLGKMVRLITSGNENREGLEEEERNNFDDIILGLGHMHETVQRKQQLLATATRRARQLRSILETPNYLDRPHGVPRDPAMLTGKRIRDSTPVFNPKIAGADFRVTWHRLKDYGDLNYFDENDYILALGQVLEEQAYLEYVQLRKSQASLRDILDHLGDTYVPKRSIYDDQLAVDKFHRLRKEPLQKAMRRALMCVEKLQHTVDAGDWPVLLRKHMEDILYKIVTPSTQRVIRKYVEIYTESGLAYDLPTLIHKAEMHEISNDASPKGEMPPQSLSAAINSVQFADQKEGSRQTRSLSRENNRSRRDLSSSTDRAGFKPNSNYRARSNSRERDRSKSRNYSRDRSRSPRRYNTRQNRDRSRSPRRGDNSSTSRNRNRSKSPNQARASTPQRSSSRGRIDLSVDGVKYMSCTHCSSLHTSTFNCPAKQLNQPSP